VWQAQRLHRGHLRTTDGRRLTVLHPGFGNREAGPDFRGAVLQWGDDPPVTGDVEVDLDPGGWRGHGHADNPAYAGVRLHAVWRAPPGAPAPLPTLALEPVLDAPLEELEAALGAGPAEEAAVWLAGRCAAPLAGRSAAEVSELLRQAGRERLAMKSAALRARARAAGWEQALWEGLFRALGYKHNTWPMQRLAELRPEAAEAGAAQGGGALVHEAVWLGVAGLLPHGRAGGAALRERWDVWWRARDALAAVTLPVTVWRRGGVRPANHPQRRVALAARWLAAADLPARLAEWFLAAGGTGAAAGLRECLEPADPGLWARRYTLISKPLTRPVPWLGAQRVTDLAVNVILPWFHARAAADAALCRRAEALFLAWPAGEDNAVLRLVRARLFGAARRGAEGGAAAQQGLLQIVHDFCAGTDALCSRCAFPALAAAWRPPDARTE
ncbi:MAG TPA: DUF2851 family protein, partial [Verrucomicrobiota bacterium]|nr:DUF2851 family protein [Verrucomicrobiota bacterium]